MTTLFVSINYSDLFNLFNKKSSLFDFFKTAFLQQWLTKNLNKADCFDSEKNLLDAINAHSHYSRTMILSFEAEEHEFEASAKEGQFRFLGHLEFEKINFLRPLESGEYSNSIKFPLYIEDNHFPEGFIYTPKQTLLSKTQIPIEAAIRVKTFLENRPSTKWFNLYSPMISELDTAIRERVSEDDFRKIVRKPCHPFAQINTDQLFNDKLQAVRTEEAIKLNMTKNAATKIEPARFEY